MMVKHVILWQLKDELSDSEKTEVKNGIKAGLEALKGKIPGLIEIRVEINPLASSNADVMLDSMFENEEALKGYAVHPSMWQLPMAKYAHTRSQESAWILKSERVEIQYFLTFGQKK